MEIKEISFSYGEDSFIRNLSGKIETGKVTTILGPNGSGKSTLLNILVRQLKPGEGDVILEGKSIAQMSVKEIAKKNCHGSSAEYGAIGSHGGAAGAVWENAASEHFFGAG